MADIPSTPSVEEQTLKESLDVLQLQVAVYETTSKQGDDEGIASATASVAEAMRLVGNSHRDPEAKKKWIEWAKQFTTGHPKERAGVLAEAKRGMFILLVTPLAAVGASIFAVGAVVYGTGLLLKSVGNVATFGVFSDRTSRDENQFLE